MDAKLKQVTLRDGDTVEYDKLLLCTGGRNRRFHVPGAEIPGVYQLRTLAECNVIRGAVQPGARAVIVGMGFIGSEVAASLRQMGLEVTAELGGKAPLATVVCDQVGGVIAGIHRGHGVQLVTEDQVVEFEGSDHLRRSSPPKEHGST